MTNILLQLVTVYMFVFLRIMNLQPCLGMTGFLTIVTVIHKLSGEVLGLHMVPHIVPSYMSKLIADDACPLCLPNFSHTELIQIIRRFNS